MEPANRWNRRALLVVVAVGCWLVFSPVAVLVLYISGYHPARLTHPQVVGPDFDVPPRPSMTDEVTSHLRPQLLGRMTQRAVVEALRAKGPMSRADISRLTGISPTTVSSAVTQVLRAGLVEETDAAITGPGRPGKILR